MKILFIAQRFHNNMYHPVKALVRSGFEVRFWAMYSQMSEMHDIVKPEILKRSILDLIFKVAAKKSDFLKTKVSVPSFWLIGYKLFRYNPDLILIKDTQNFLSIFMLIWCAIFRKRSYLLVQTDKHSVRSRAKRIFVWMLKNICCVKGVITPLRNRNGAGDPFFKYIPFIYEVSDIEKEHFKNDRINIIDIGKFNRRKDHLSLIKAVSMLKDKKYDVHLTIVGEKMDIGIEDEIYQYMDRNKLGGLVEVFVNIAPKEVRKMFADHDLYVLPSYDEPAAYSVVEAMSNGLPVIVSDTCGTKCYVEEGGNGYVFKSKDVEDLAEKIELAIRDRHNLVKLGKRSYELALQEHSVSFFLSKFKEIIENK